MKYFEYGQQNSTLVVLLHGGLIAEHTGQFIREVKTIHAVSPEGRS